MPVVSASRRTPARTGTGGRVGRLRAVHVTASARTSRSTRNLIPHLSSSWPGRRCRHGLCGGPGGQASGEHYARGPTLGTGMGMTTTAVSFVAVRRPPHVLWRCVDPPPREVSSSSSVLCTVWIVDVRAGQAAIRLCTRVVGRSGRPVDDRGRLSSSPVLRPPVGGVPSTSPWRVIHRRPQVSAQVWRFVPCMSHPEGEGSGQDPRIVSTVRVVSCRDVRNARL